MAAPTFDLQAHSESSDGSLGAVEVVARAADAGVELFSLTDHDSVAGVADAFEAGRRAGVRVVPGTEISSISGEHEDLHLLGYGIDPADALLGERLAEARGDRARRAGRMAERLRGTGFELDDALLERRRAAGGSLGRPHLARAVLDHPANAERLADEGLEDVSDFIPAYLVAGAPGYAPRTRPTLPEAIAWVHEAGGVAVWAHPFFTMETPGEVLAALDRFQTAGLDGVEAFYVTHTREQTVALADECDRRGMLATGSSDFHGPEHRLFWRFRAFELFGREPRLGPLADAP
jgi:predicted metal-dependent phosphoesterase TrpH